MEHQAIIEGHGPDQNVWEMNELLVTLQRHLPDVGSVVEIGTGTGASARVWRDVLQPHVVVTVDVDGRDRGDMDGIVGVFGDRSQHPETVRRVREAVSDRIGFLFIDGSHTYADTWEDYEAYGRFVPEGGAIGVHDIGANRGIASPSARGWHTGLVWDELVGKGGRTVSFRHAQGTGLILL